MSVFVLELPLKTNQQQEKVLSTRFESARQLYNACLSEALRRLRHKRQSKLFQKACKMPKGSERTKAFNHVDNTFAFSEYALHAYAKDVGYSWIRTHLDSNTIQKIATRAFQAVKEYSFGERGRPRFKGKRGLRSLEGKTNKSGIRFRETTLHWTGLSMSTIVDTNDEVVRYGLQQKITFCRILRKTIRGKVRWFVQLVLEGKSYLKKDNQAGPLQVGLDIGPSTVAIVDEHEARLVRFCDELQTKDESIKRLQRRMERSRRATNPENYNEDGTCKKGKKVWIRSNRYKKLQREKAELERRCAEHRARLHGRLSNEVIRRGCDIYTEDVCYRSFQKNFGASIGRRAPSMFEKMVERKAERADGQLKKCNTFQTALSQVCFCGRRKKKSLSERTHRCECGVVANQDLFSGYLVRFVEEDVLNAKKAREGWKGAQPLLQAALRVYEVANRSLRTSHPVLSCGLSDSSAKERIVLVEAQDAVTSGATERRELEKGEYVDGEQLWLPFGDFFSS